MNTRTFFSLTLASLGILLSLLLVPPAAALAEPIPPSLPDGQTLVFVDPGPGQAWSAHSVGQMPAPARSASAVTMPVVSGTASFVQSETLIVVYRNTVAGLIDEAGKALLEQQIQRTVTFNWRHSHEKFYPRVTYLYIDAYKDLSEFTTPCHMLIPGDGDGDGASVNADLVAAGVTPGQYDSINIFWSVAAGTTSPCAGGWTFPTSTWPALGTLPVTSNTLFWGGGDYNPWNHEFQHAIHGMFLLSDSTAYYNADYPQSQPGRFGENWDFHAHQMQRRSADDWSQIVEPLNAFGQSPDADNDGLPDSGPLPVTEATLQTSTARADTDGDGLSDQGETMAGLQLMANPKVPDTDGDGLADGVDSEPLYAAAEAIPRMSHVLDGNPAGWSPYLNHIQESNTPVAVPVYASYDDNYLYLMFLPDRAMTLTVRLDASGDGWFHGRDNYEIRFDAADPARSLSAHVLDATGNSLQWDDDPAHPGGRLIDPATILRFGKPKAPGYLIQLAIPASAATGLGSDVEGLGFCLELQYVAPIGGYGRALEMDEIIYSDVRGPEVTEPNDTLAQAYPIALGDIVEGVKISDRADVDFYSFAGKARDTIVADIDARSIGSNADLSLYLYDASGKSIAWSSDFAGEDPRLHYTLPADGTYYLQVRRGIADVGLTRQPYRLVLDLVVYVGVNTTGTVAGVSYDPADILAYYRRANRWELFFDGSDVGLKRLGDFAITPYGDLLFALGVSRTLPDAGPVTPSDIVSFRPDSLGPTTSGHYTLWFDGSDVQLSTTSEKIDAFDIDPAGRLLISTSGSAVVGKPLALSAQDEDVLAFTQTRLGSTTQGAWSILFDGSDVGLAALDVTGVWADPFSNRLYFAFDKPITMSGKVVDPGDTALCAPGTLGPATSCVWSEATNTSQRGLGRQLLDGLAFGASK